MLMKFFLEKVCPGLDSHMQGHRPQPVNLHYNPKAQYGKDGLQTCVKVRSCKPSETISLQVTLKIWKPGIKRNYRHPKTSAHCRILLEVRYLSSQLYGTRPTDAVHHLLCGASSICAKRQRSPFQHPESLLYHLHTRLRVRP